MDPISFVASITALIGVTSKVVGYLNEIKSAPDERAKLAREIANLVPLLTDLRYAVEDAKTTDPWFSGLKSIGGKGGLLEGFREEMEEVATKLEPLVGVHKLKGALLWPLKKEIDAVLSRVERLKTSILHAKQKDRFKISQVINENVTAWFQALRDKDEAASISTWLAAPDPSMNHELARKKRQPKTGEWFTRGSHFTIWKDQPSSFLWLYGIRKACISN